MQKWVLQGKNSETLPTVHIVSDSVGTTAQALVRATAACFEVFDPAMEVLPHVTSVKGMLDELEVHVSLHRRLGLSPFVLFYTLVSPDTREAMEKFVKDNDDIVVAVDAITPAIEALAKASNVEPIAKPGHIHSVNDYYFRRIDAMEFTISHDDGRNPQDLPDADMVLIGVSRSSKTPLSIYLSQMGYRVANVPLDPQSNPPKEIFEVDPTRLFGLIISPEILSDIRKKRLGKAANVAASYADLECVYQDLESARDLMRKLGCIVIRTDNRAIEETAQEILRYYESAHPQFN